MTGEHAHTALKEGMVPDLLLSSECMPITEQCQVATTISFQLCSARYAALQAKEQYEKCLCNQSSHNGKLGHYKCREAIMQRYCKSTPCTVRKDKWDTKEDTGKSMKHALYVLQYA